jgi:LuxR family transcriptional regulator of spore coat protein
MSAYSSSSPFPASELTECLSDRQRQCLALAARGLSSTRIAERIGISARTVDEHLMMACRVLGVRTRIQAVARLAGQPSRRAEPRTFRP